AVVGGNEVLARAVLDRAHAFLHGRVLVADAVHAREALARLLRAAVDQIVVALVRDWHERARNKRHVDAAAGWRRAVLQLRELAPRMVVDAENPAALVVDGHESVTAGRIVAIGRKKIEARHEELRDA